MPSAFGFSTPNQQPTPDPRAVGAQLMQPRQPQQPQQFDIDPVDAVFPTRSREAALRREGGKLAGGGGNDADSHITQAVADALTRAGGGHRGNPNPHKNRDANVRQLMHLGISELEAELLREVV